MPIADAAAEMFYARLFVLDPALRPLFNATAMPEQRRKLIAALNLAVGSLDDLAALRPTIEALGRRHVGYGVTAAHYHVVGAALLWTLEQGLGPAFTPRVAAAWREVYGLLAGIMQQAVREMVQCGAAQPAAA